MEQIEVGYALAKQVPDMQHQVDLQTSYGALRFEGDDAKRIADVVREILEEKYSA